MRSQINTEKCKGIRSYVYFLSLLLISLLLFSGCHKTSEEVQKIAFLATIASLDNNTLLVNPKEDTKEYQLCGQIYVPLKTSIVDSNGRTLTDKDLYTASEVKITYDGVLDNSDPAQIQNVYEIMVIE